MKSIRNGAVTRSYAGGRGALCRVGIMGCSIQDTFRDGRPFCAAPVPVILFMTFSLNAILWLPNLVYGTPA